MDRDKIIKMVLILAAIVVIAGSLSKAISRNSMSLTEYVERNHPAEGTADAASLESISPASESSAQNEAATAASPEPFSTTLPPAGSSNSAPSSTSPEPDVVPTQLIGASLNGSSQSEDRVLLEDGFYYEPVSDALRRYMTGISYPAAEGEIQPEITFEELRYVHILHFDFDGYSTEGELICNEWIADDLLDIFYELYRNEYRLEKVLLIDEYEGDDTASMEDNNTSCFNYRPVEGSTHLSKHALGLAIDINPFYNPYITYAEDGSEVISPASSSAYADRSVNFPYKIDEDDLCYKLFTQHGFTWGGNWNNVKDYQHFQKVK